MIAFGWKWTPTRLKHLASLLASIGHVALASVAVPSLFNAFEPVRGLVGLVFALAFWVGSLVALKEEI